MCNIPAVKNSFYINIILTISGIYLRINNIILAPNVLIRDLLYMRKERLLSTRDYLKDVSALFLTLSLLFIILYLL